MTTSGWRATTQERHAVVNWSPATRLAATLDLAAAPGPGEPLPPLWHWLYFLPAEPQAALASDGHPRRGDFLPPVTHRRRMYAGGRFEFHAPLQVGDPATCTSTVAGVADKEGRSGPLVVVTVRHDITGPGGPAITEEQDLVYTDAPPGEQPAAPVPIPHAAWERTVVPDEALLFRFSALTFNAHRIHYDHPYTTGVEGYPGLVVHGPLVALLLAELARRHGTEMAGFTFRARAPFFCGRPIHLRGGPGGKLAAYDDGGRVGIEASFT